MDEQEKIKPSKIEIMMRDYELMKNYSNNSPRIRYNIISFALATIGIVISGLVFALSSGTSGKTFYLVIEIILLLMIFLSQPLVSQYFLSCLGKNIE